MNRMSKLSKEGDNERFDMLIAAITRDFSGKLYYHEMIGILNMHAHRLAMESFEVGDEAEEEDDEILGL